MLIDTAPTTAQAETMRFTSGRGMWRLGWNSSVNVGLGANFVLIDGGLVQLDANPASAAEI